MKCGKIWNNFFKECKITEQWKRVMLHNHTHKIIHSSAMYYQNLIIIHECSKKLLKMKYSKFFLTPSIKPFSVNIGAIGYWSVSLSHIKKHFWVKIHFDKKQLPICWTCVSVPFCRSRHTIQPLVSFSSLERGLQASMPPRHQPITREQVRSRSTSHTHPRTGWGRGIAVGSGESEDTGGK